MAELGAKKQKQISESVAGRKWLQQWNKPERRSRSALPAHPTFAAEFRKFYAEVGLPSIVASMHPTVRLASAAEVLPLRTRHRAEMSCQIVHDSIHTRRGWTEIYLLELEGRAVGYGTVAIAGPWKGKPTFLEFYVLPEARSRAFDLFDAFLAVARPQYLEVQSNDTLASIMAMTYGSEISSEKIVFHDVSTTQVPGNAAVLQGVTAREEILASIDQRAGGGEWILTVDGTTVAKGGILFHYNVPYGDIYMDVVEPFRRRGFGSYLVQELKRIAYELGAIPCARCDPDNIASRRTLLRAGFAPFANILIGRIGKSKKAE